MAPWTTHLRLEVTVNVSKLMELVDTQEHFSCVKLGVLLFQHTRVVEQRSEVSARYVFLSISLAPSPPREPHHRKEDVVLVLESIKQSNQPGRLDRAQDISLDQDMLDFVHLCQCSLPHLLQRAYLVGVDFADEVD